MPKTAIGVEENIAGALAYCLGWVSGLVIILLEKDNDFVRFHAMQSIVIFGALTILSVMLGSILSFGFFFSFASLINLAAMVLWVVLMVKAYQGERFSLPIVGELAEQWSKNFKI